MSQGKGGRKNRGQYYNKDKVNVGDNGREVIESIDENSLITQQFRNYAAELDEKYDRYERIFKINRDICIASKRIIFLLHTIDSEKKRDFTLASAKLRLDRLAQTLFRDIAKELYSQDVYQYHRAYSAGLEEYVEALMFHEYLENGSCTQNWTNLEESLIYHMSLEALDVTVIQTMRILVSPTDYILGMADLTGELMRRCINNLVIGDIASCYYTCNFVRHIYVAFLGYTNSSSNKINRKLYTLKQNLNKIEKTCYTIKVRGSEIPKHMLADVAIRETTEEYATEDDEGYQAF